MFSGETVGWIALGVSITHLIVRVCATLVARRSAARRRAAKVASDDRRNASVDRGESVGAAMRRWWDLPNE